MAFSAVSPHLNSPPSYTENPTISKMAGSTGIFGSLFRRKSSMKSDSGSMKSPSRQSSSLSSPSAAQSPVSPSSRTVPSLHIPRRPKQSQRPSEQPPSYSEATSNRSSESNDGPYAFLKSFDTIFVLDDSGSMRGRSWRESKEALAAIAPICTKYDADGIDVYFLNDKHVYKHIKSAGAVNEIFTTVTPRGGTPTGQRLHNILKPYLDTYTGDPTGTKPINIIVITDGIPTDDVESPIITTAKKLDKLDAPPWQIGIQFFQVGNEPEARQHLKDLDDNLAEMAGDDDLRDIVDTVPYMQGENTINADGILKVVLGAVNRRLDRSRTDLHSPTWR